MPITTDNQYRASADGICDSLPGVYTRLQLLKESLISASECAEDSVSKLTSLVKAMD